MGDYIRHCLGVVIKHFLNFFFDFWLIRSIKGFAGDVEPLWRRGCKTQSIDYGLLKSALAYANIERFKRIIDVGSGKGRCCAYLSWRYPTYEIIGVELNHEVAQESIRTLQRCKRDVKVIEGDVLKGAAKTFLGQQSLYLLFNPFDDFAFSDFLKMAGVYGGVVLFINASQAHYLAAVSVGYKVNAYFVDKWYLDIDRKMLLVVDLSSSGL